jgi:hypothetical protein
MAPPDQKRQGTEPASESADASDTPHGLVPPEEHSDAYGPVIDRDMDRATGEGEVPAGDARTHDADSRGSRR